MADSAVEHFQMAVAIAPSNSQYVNALGAAHLSRRGYADARECFKRALALEPDNLDATLNLANLLRLAGRYAEAVEAHQSVLKREPNSSAALLNLGVVYCDMDRHDLAAESFRLAIQKQPNLAEAHNNLGNSLERDGDLGGAETEYLAAVALKPSLSDGHHNLGNLYRRQGRYDVGADHYEHAPELDPRSSRTWFDFALLRQLSGNPAGAVDCYLNALEIDHANVIFRQGLLACLTVLREPPNDDRLLKEIAASLEHEEIDRQRAAAPATAILKEDNAFRVALDSARLGALEKALEAGALDDALLNVLFLRLLQHTVIADVELELLATKLRATTLAASQRGPLPRSLELLLPSLVHQCLNNEYVFSVTVEERSRTSQMHGEIERAFASDRWLSARIQQSMLVLAMYQSLDGIESAPRLLAATQGQLLPALSTVVDRQLRHQVVEQQVAKTIKRASRVEGEGLLRVQAQYEENPYPRWLTVDRHPPTTPTAHLRALFPHIRPRIAPDGRILIAGCGTGKHAFMVARRFPDSQITAVDISRRSLAFAARMAVELEVHNVEFIQADLSELDTSLGRFALIECVGVLHHTADPERGCRSLAQILEPDGFLKLGLYSGAGRLDVAAARVGLAERTAPATPDTIRQLREGVKQRRQRGDAHAAAVTRYQDFYTMSGCRDLFFNVHEDLFDLARVGKMLDESGLTLVGFEFPEDWPTMLYRAWFPEDPTMTDLSHWNALERVFPRMFASMYQFWSHKGLAVTEECPPRPQ
jgi:tetratricopeptide (TPR) repeat protein/SAM-dependent methyltransferase